MTIWHYNVAVSLDGKIARPDGSVDDWLVNEHPADSEKFEVFLSSIDAILMGRDTYEVVRRMGTWPYSGKPTIVMTNRPIDDAPPEVTARTGDLEAVVQEMEATGYRRVWIEGGGKVVRDMIALGKLDVLEMAVIPIILGDGIPLFPCSTAKLKLETAKPWIKDALHLVYRRAA
jgi:dihydrofolate reductase